MFAILKILVGCVRFRKLFKAYRICQVVFLKQESLFYNVHMPFRDTKPYKYNMTLLEYKGAGYKNSTDPTESSRLVSRFKAIYILTFSYCVA